METQEATRYILFESNKVGPLRLFETTDQDYQLPTGIPDNKIFDVITCREITQIAAIHYRERVRVANERRSIIKDMSRELGLLETQLGIN